MRMVFLLILVLSIIIPQLMPDILAEENTVIATISVGDKPNDIAFDSANNRMYVTNYHDDTVSVINTATNAVDATVTTAGAGGNGNTPHGIAFDSANNRMYYAIGNWMFVENEVSVINTANNLVIATITVGDNPHGIAFDSANNRMYVTNYNDDTVSVINTANNSVIATVSVGDGPGGIAFDSANNRMYVVNANDDTVSVIDIAPNADSSNGSDCYDCEPPKLQSTWIQVSSEKPVIILNVPIHITANVGDTISVTLKITDNKSIDTIPFAALYTNFQEKPNAMNLFYANNFDDDGNISTSFYEWNIRSDDVTYDYEDTVSWNQSVPQIVTADTTEDNYSMINDYNVVEYFLIPFTFTINEHMDSQIIVKIYDATGNRLQVTLPVTLKTAGNEPLDFDYTGKQKVLGFYDESVLAEMVEQWSESESDAKQLSSLLGISEEQLPPWTSNLATWVAQDKIDSADMIIAIEYLINQ